MMAVAFTFMHDMCTNKTQDALRRVFGGWYRIPYTRGSTSNFVSYSVLCLIWGVFSRVVFKTLLENSKTDQDTIIVKLLVYYGKF